MAGPQAAGRGAPGPPDAVQPQGRQLEVLPNRTFGDTEDLGGPARETRGRFCRGGGRQGPVDLGIERLQALHGDPAVLGGRSWRSVFSRTAMASSRSRVAGASRSHGGSIRARMVRQPSRWAAAGGASRRSARRADRTSWGSPAAPPQWDAAAPWDQPGSGQGVHLPSQAGLSAAAPDRWDRDQCTVGEWTQVHGSSFHNPSRRVRRIWHVRRSGGTRAPKASLPELEERGPLGVEHRQLVGSRAGDPLRELGGNLLLRRWRQPQGRQALVDLLPEALAMRRGVPVRVPQRGQVAHHPLPGPPGHPHTFHQLGVAAHS